MKPAYERSLDETIDREKQVSYQSSPLDAAREDPGSTADKRSGTLRLLPGGAQPYHSSAGPGTCSLAPPMTTLEAYPPARIPLRPVLALSEVALSTARVPFPSVLEAGEVAFVTSGRVAVALALRELALEEGAEVLVPAFHCSSMVEPVVWAGGQPRFFRIREDGAVDLDDVRAKFNTNTRAILVAHYFGFPQDMPTIRRFCDEHGIALIEDCAHAFFGSIDGRPLGSFGDYACASPWKFFPAYDGGCLISARHSLGHLGLVTSGWRYEVKSLVNSLEQAFEYGRMPVARTLLGIPLRSKDALLRWIKQRRSSPAPEIGPSALDGGFAFEPAWIDKRMSTVSRWLIQRAPGHEIAAARRRNYLRIRDALDGVRGIRPFADRLPDNVVPHVFPAYVHAGQSAFAELRRRAVPMLRFGEQLWRGVDESVCAASIDFSRHVAQFPCHQGLTDDEIDWMAREIRLVLERHDGSAPNRQE